MNILFIASEMTPLVKVGGLADVVGALPAALNNINCETRVLLPKYGVIDQRLMSRPRQVLTREIAWQDKKIKVVLESAKVKKSGIEIFLLDCPPLFKAGAVYYEHFGPGGERYVMERYAFFSWAAANILDQLPWSPDIVHCHDWHAAAVPVWLKVLRRPAPTVLSIHNTEGQGRWAATEVLSWLHLTGDESPELRVRDQWGNFNFLRAGIKTADAVNTVSPTYAKEITTPKLGAGLDRDFVNRPGGVIGILNGIDVELFDPATDKSIFSNYDDRRVTAGKQKNRQALAEKLGLADPAAVMFGLVGRLTPQKGIAAVIEVIPRLVERGANLVVLGSGHPELESKLSQLAAKWPANVLVHIGFDAVLAQKIYAASDYFLMPSLFEPCGLGQMIAMRYGSLPIVRDTGGLHDTVVDLTEHPVSGTGFVHRSPTGGALWKNIESALQLAAQPDKLLSTRVRAMNQDFSWAASAKLYHKLYAKTIRS